MENEYSFVFSISTVPEMLNKADSLLALADIRPDDAKVLAACAAVVLAATLDQGTLTVLANAAAIEAQTKNLDADNTEFAHQREEWLRTRVIELTAWLTKGKYELDRRSPHVRAIHDLITLRNDLMHVNEEPRVGTTRPPFNFSVGTLTNRWLTVSLEEARAYRAAVGIYVDEVLFPSNGEIRRGRIVSPKGIRR